MSSSDDSSLEDLARLAIDGDRGALDLVVRELQSRVYGLALRMLWNKEDAEDATQEILVRIVTRLSRFDFRSRLQTWAYRVAVNYILDVKKSAVERLHMSFERFADSLETGLDTEADSNVEHSVLVEEVKLGCTLGMLVTIRRVGDRSRFEPFLPPHRQTFHGLRSPSPGPSPRSTCATGRSWRGRRGCPLGPGWPAGRGR